MARLALTENEMEQLLHSQRLVRVAFHAEGCAYLIPLGYVWFEGALHLMTTPGEKTRLAEANPRVAFQVDDASEAGMLDWSSVTGEGRWEVVADRQLRGRLIEELMQRFPELAEWARGAYAEKTATGQLMLVRIVPSWMTGRAFRPVRG